MNKHYKRISTFHGKKYNKNHDNNKTQKQTQKTLARDGNRTLDLSHRNPMCYLDTTATTALIFLILSKAIYLFQHNTSKH